MDQTSRIFDGDAGQVGKVFGVKINGKWQRAKFEGTEKFGGFAPAGSTKKTRTLTRYQFTNLKTGRKVVIKSRLKIAGMQV